MPKTDDTVIEDDKAATPVVAPSLDQVHAISQANVEAEDEENEAAKEKEDVDAGDGGGEADDGDVTADDKGGAGADDGDDVAAAASDDTSTAGATKPTETATITADSKPAESTTELDTDVTKNDKGKVAIKNADGETLYFNNLDEIPEGFEPVSYKALMVGTRALLVKEQNDAQAAKDAEATAATEAHNKATEDLQKAWEADASSLVRAGTLPNEPAKLEAAKNEVYDYIEAEMKKGNVITSFSQAYKGMMYDKDQAAKVEKQGKINEAKKNRGAIVQGGSGADAGGSSSTRGNRIIEAPPAGVGLDAVHARAISSL